MENLSPQQRAQLEVSQFKDFIATYNHVTQNCFEDCVKDFTSRRVTKDEVLWRRVQRSEPSRVRLVVLPHRSRAAITAWTSTSR